jgi:toxin secretion/phage lysis holin
MLGAAVAELFGGWDQALQTLVIFMVIDYLTGLAVAGIFKNSKKTESGGLESKAGWKGLCRKATELVFVLAGYQIDLLMGIDYVRLAIIVGFCGNELISIVENAGLMGLPLPDAVLQAIDLLNGKEEGEDDEHKA